MAAQLPFVNVPKAPGVPFVPRALTAIDNIVLLTTDLLTLLGVFPAQIWGVFDSGGNLIAQSDAFLRVGQQKGYRLSNFPIEGGTFATYNKVRLPSQTRVTLSKGGSVSDRAAFLSAIDAAVDSFGTYSIVMPEAVYPSVNIESRSFEREATQGSGLLSVELRIQEILVAPGPMFTQTAQPDGAGTVSTGQVQTTTPSGLIAGPV